MTSCPVRVRSLVTIDNERRQSGVLRLGAQPTSRRRTRPPSTLSSVAIASVASRGRDTPSLTIVATCLRDKKNEGANLGGDAVSGGGRLSVALVGPDDRVQMRYSAPGRNFNTVGIVPSPSDSGCANLLAVGDNGKLWTGPIDIDADRRIGIELPLRECPCQYRESRTSDSPRKKAKYEIPDWTRVDTFTPMLESDDVVTPSSRECSPGRKGMRASGMHLSPRAFVLATRMNTRCSPTLMELTLCEQSNCCSWLRMSGLEDMRAPITSVFFASKDRCGARIWAKLTSSMGQSIQQRGIALLGLEDGSLMASIVTATDEGDLSKVTRAIRLFKLATAEPLLSIQILEMSQQHKGEGATEQVLLCTGALGNIVSLKSNGDSDCFVFETTLPSCEGRWTSLTCVGLRAVNGDHCYVSFVGANDSRSMFACSVTLKQICKDDQQDYQQEIHQLSSPPRIASVHGPQSCLAIKMDSSMHFVSARVDGRVCLAALMELNRSSDQCVSQRNSASLLPTLKISGGSDLVVPKSTPDLYKDGRLVYEVREATKIASRITAMTECDGGGIFGCSMSTNNLNQENQALNWVTTRHLLQPNYAIPRAFPRSIEEAKPVCYRRTCDGVPVKVVFGGTASSYANAETHSSQVNAVPANANPITAFSSMSLIYSDSMRSWFPSDKISRSTELNASCTACRSSDAVVVGVSLTLGSRTFDLLSGVSDGQASSQLPRVDAEGLINCWFQRNMDVCAVSKEELWYKRRMEQNTPGSMLPGTVHCFSDSIELINVPRSLQNVHSCRLFRGVGPVAIVLRLTQDDVTSIDFALGSLDSLPTKLPLLRRAILSRVLMDSKNMSNKDLSRKVGLFYSQISHKETSKLLKYISRQADSLLARLECDNSCPDELERASLSLYDTLRARLKLTF